MHNPKISLIAAIGKNRELGKGNKLLFHIPEDMTFFREKTRGHVVIMGRKTYQSIGRPLPDRTNIIVSRTPKFKLLNSNVKVVHSIEEALDFAKTLRQGLRLSSAERPQGKPEDELFVIGGAQIYSLALPYADKLYLTLVDSEVPDADAFFPDYSEFKKIISETEGESEGLKYKFITLER